MPMFIDQSIESFENWRDLQHDRPEPDSEAPDEHIKRSFTHDHPEDTTLTYTRMGAHAELKLTFASEAPDAGVEECNGYCSGSIHYFSGASQKRRLRPNISNPKIRRKYFLQYF